MWDTIFNCGFPSSFPFNNTTKKIVVSTLNYWSNSVFKPLIFQWCHTAYCCSNDRKSIRHYSFFCHKITLPSYHNLKKKMCISALKEISNTKFFIFYWEVKNEFCKFLRILANFFKQFHTTGYALSSIFYFLSTPNEKSFYSSSLKVG